MGLFHEIQQALAKSQERVARVAAASGVPALNEDTLQEEKEVPTSTSENQNDEQVPDDTLEISIPDIHSNEDLMNEFWKSRADSSFVVFLPCLDSAGLIQKIMNISALETLCLDMIQPQGDHRRESLRKTCLDFFAAAAAAGGGGSFEKAPITQGVIQAEAAIDPNVPLCPYELAGVCADVYCPYQHMKPRTTPILARERLPLPTLKLPETLLSVDSEMESLPPSPLKKRRRVEDVSVEAAAPREESDEDDSAVSYGSEEATGHIEQDASNGGSNNEQPVTVEWNDDFVSLPPASNTIGENDSVSSDDDSKGLTDLLPDVASAQDDKKLWWLTDDDIARMKNFQDASPQLQASFLQWMEVVGGFKVNQTRAIPTFAIVFNGCPTSPAEKISLVARVVDCVRVSIHAGRFDLTHALCNFVSATLNGASADNRESDADCTIDILLRTVVQHMKTTRDAAFGFNSDQRSTFRCAFEAEVSLSTMATFLNLLHTTEQTDDPVERGADWLRQWSDTLDEVLGLFHTASPEDTRDLGPQQKEAKPTNRYKRQREYNFLKIVAPDDDSIVTKKKTPLDYLEVLCGSTRTGLSIVKSSAQATVDSLVDDFLTPALSDLRRLAGETSRGDKGAHCDIQSSLYMMGYLLLGCAESACAHAFSLGDLDVDTSATLTAIESCTHQIVTALTAIASGEPLAELALSPLHALSVSLASTLRRYGKAQHRLESALNSVLAKRRISLYGHVGLMLYSELLWSQLIQLRASLPLQSETPSKVKSLSLPDSIESGHEALAVSLVRFGVHPNHVTLCGDWNLLKAFCVDSEGNVGLKKPHIRKQCHTLLSNIFTTANQSIATTSNDTTESSMQSMLSLSNLPLSLTPNASKSLPMAWSLAFPRSALLAGQNLHLLVANKCKLKELPVTFGLYFPNLKVCLVPIAVMSTHFLLLTFIFLHRP